MSGRDAAAAHERGVGLAQAGVVYGDGIGPARAAAGAASPAATIVCRCEGVTLADLHEAHDRFAPSSARELKLVTRAGMGICQGRVCGAVVEALAQRWCGTAAAPAAGVGSGVAGVRNERGVEGGSESPEAAARLVQHPPLRPVSLGTLADGEAVGEVPAPSGPQTADGAHAPSGHQTADGAHTPPNAARGSSRAPEAERT